MTDETTTTPENNPTPENNNPSTEDPKPTGEETTSTSDSKTALGSGGAVEPPAPGVLDKDQDPPAKEGADDDGFEVEFAEEGPFSEADQESIIENIEGQDLNKEQAQNFVESLERAYQAGVNKNTQDVGKLAKEQQRQFYAHENFNTEEKKKESFGFITPVVQAYDNKEFNEYLNGPAGDDIRLANFLRWIGQQVGAGTDQSILTKGTELSSENN